MNGHAISMAVPGKLKNGVCHLWGPSHEPTGGGPLAGLDQDQHPTRTDVVEPYPHPGGGTPMQQYSRMLLELIQADHVVDYSGRPARVAQYRL